MNMIDPWNPTKEEISKWAYSNELIPDQDWELAVYDIDNIDLIIKLACDIECKHREFFLGCLYVFTGDIIDSKDNDEIIKLKSILLKASRQVDPEIVEWVARSSELIAHPEKYSYKYWGLDSAYVYKWRLKHD